MNSSNTSEKIINKQQSFENGLSTKYRKDFGVFLTNNISTVDDILSVIEFDETILEKKILEPACGQGIFLVRLIEKLYDKFPSKSIIEKFLAKNLIFVDIDSRMVDATKNNLANYFYTLFHEKYSSGFQCYVYDFTKRLKVKQSNLFSQDISLERGETRKVIFSPENSPELNIEDPRIWWPNHLGDPEMYSLNMSISIDQNISDQTILKFGIRDVKDYINESGHRGYKINGKKVQIMGAGWVDDVLLADPDEKVEELLHAPE